MWYLVFICYYIFCVLSLSTSEYILQKHLCMTNEIAKHLLLLATKFTYFSFPLKMIFTCSTVSFLLLGGFNNPVGCGGAVYDVP